MALTPRNRWLTAGAIAVVLHIVVVQRACRVHSPLGVQKKVRGAPEPTYLHMEVRESAHDGAPVAAAVPFATKPSSGEGRMQAPQKPRAGLWVLDAPLRSVVRAPANDAGPD